MGTHATTLAIVVVNLSGFLNDLDGRIRAIGVADAATVALVCVNARDKCPPMPGLVNIGTSASANCSCI
jgi:hypothetical protein